MHDRAKMRAYARWQYSAGSAAGLTMAAAVAALGSAIEWDAFAGGFLIGAAAVAHWLRHLARRDARKVWGAGGPNG